MWVEWKVVVNYVSCIVFRLVMIGGSVMLNVVMKWNNVVINVISDELLMLNEERFSWNIFFLYFIIFKIDKK